MRALLLVLVLAAGCYAHGPKPPPCVNIENCGNPSDYPPLTDSKNPDAGR
jgi:hypothetical protein